MSTEQTTTPGSAPTEDRCGLNLGNAEFCDFPVAPGGSVCGHHQRQEIRRLAAELERVRPVVDAARAWCEGRAPSSAVYAAVAALDGDAAATPATAGCGDPDPGALIGRTDDWWVGYSAGCEASHAIGCSAVEAERDHLREQLERCEVVSEQRIADLQAEFARRDKIRDRQLDAARASLAAVSSAPPVDVTAEIAWHVAQLRRDGASPVAGSAHYDEGWRNAYVQAANDLEARAEHRALATPTTDTPGGDR